MFYVADCAFLIEDVFVTKHTGIFAQTIWKELQTPTEDSKNFIDYLWGDKFRSCISSDLKMNHFVVENVQTGSVFIFLRYVHAFMMTACKFTNIVCLSDLIEVKDPTSHAQMSLETSYV